MMVGGASRTGKEWERWDGPRTPEGGQAAKVIAICFSEGWMTVRAARAI